MDLGGTCESRSPSVEREGEEEDGGGEESEASSLHMAITAGNSQCCSDR